MKIAFATRVNAEVSKERWGTRRSKKKKTYYSGASSIIARANTG